MGRHRQSTRRHRASVSRLAVWLYAASAGVVVLLLAVWGLLEYQARAEVAAVEAGPLGPPLRVTAEFPPGTGAVVVPPEWTPRC